MPIESDLMVSLFSARLRVKDGFEAASGRVDEKEILQLLFSKKGAKSGKNAAEIDQEAGERFVFELPLSPSLGAMPEDVKKDFKAGLFATNPQSSGARFLRRALSYYRGMNSNQSFNVSMPQESIQWNIKTISMHDSLTPAEINPQIIYKIKAAPRNLREAICKIGAIAPTARWAIDFNGSLSELELAQFLESCDLSQCLFIEQPLAKGRYKNLNSLDAVKGWCKQRSLPSNVSRVFLIADEDMSSITPKQFEESMYDGFVIKLIRHDFEDLLQWIQFGQSHHLPFMIGNMICDQIAAQFDVFWNKYCSIQWQSNEGSDLLIDEHPLRTSVRFGGKVPRWNHATFQWLKERYELVGQFTNASD